MGVWEPVLRKDMDVKRAKTVSLRWDDTDKGDADRPHYRSRMAVREIKKATKKSDVPSAAELHSGMPPLESKCENTPLSVRPSQSGRGEKQANPCKYDISRAHFHGVPVRRVFVELPDEEKVRLARDNVHDLEYVDWLSCMYGPVDATGRWQAPYAQILKET